MASTNVQTSDSTQRTVIKIGSRQSKLALVQARAVQARLGALYPEADFQLSARTITVAGDRDKVCSS